VTDFERTQARLDYEFGDERFMRGAQVVVEVAGERLFDVALGDNGLGVPLTAEHIFRVYCTIKPFLAVLIARLVEGGAVALDGPLSTYLPDLRCLDDGVTLRHVMTHTAGLHTLMGVTMEIARPEKRRELVSRVAKPIGWRIGHDAGYSEYAGWQILGWLIEAITGERLREYIRTKLLEPLGIQDTFIGMTHDEYADVVPRIGVNCDLRQLGSFPMLFERSERVCTETNPAHGGYTNARDLAAFYSALLARLGGGGNDALPSAAMLGQFCRTVREPVFDVVLDRECAYGLGFMTRLDQHAFGESCSPASFGHSGNVGTSFAFADPERSLAIGVVFNGLVSYETAFLRRRALIRAIYLDLDDTDSEPVDVVLGVSRKPGLRRTRIRGKQR
jgi:CubicO group peptidase (beta-lactamase class C family)